MKFSLAPVGLLAAALAPAALAQNDTRVDDTFFCATSTFISFPGLPVYASKDLVNWKLISHAWTRESQLPGVSWNTTGQQDGMYAPTLRYHDGEFWLICEYLNVGPGIIGVLFRTTDPFDDDAWSDPLLFSPQAIDPDLFWDDDGKVYAATQGIILQELDLETGELSQPPIEIWTGTGGVWPEGPHIYKRHGYYYLLIAEGGTATDHAITIARSENIDGPYEAYENNPILTNRNTDEYFQTVGHGDLFTDVDGNWWGLCLATRSGPEYKHYPMGREAVLFNVTWDEGEWPVLEPVRGRMEGWPLPPQDRDIPGDGPFNSDPDEYDFSADSGLPKHFVHWRVPAEGIFSTSDNGLEIVPSRNNLTGVLGSNEDDIALTGQRGLSFVGRRQTHTLFDFSVDLSFSPSEIGQEAGVTVFLTQVNHIDLGLVLLESSNGTALHLRMRAEGTGTPPPEETVALPEGWEGKPVRLHITAEDPQMYALFASSDDGEDIVEVGTASSELVSGGNGSFVGSLLGAYATCNGEGSGTECPEGGVASFQRWRYTPVAQYIAEDESVPA
jgi:beta-xylosidase